MEILLSVCIGVGLAAACGFRIFLPCLVLSASSMAGLVELSPGFAWLAGWPALACFTAAALVELAAYLVPWLDNLLDGLAGPLAVIAGILLSAAVIRELDPLFKWSLALIAGGGPAAGIQFMTTAWRGLSLAGTGGLANPLVSAVEAGGAVSLSLLAVFLPLAALLFLLLISGLLFFGLRRLKLLRRKKPPTAISNRPKRSR